MSGPQTIVLCATDAGARLDRYLAGRIDELSRSRIQQLIQEGFVLVDGRRIAPSYRLQSGEIIRVDLPEPRSASPLAEPIPLTVLYEDNDVLVLDKPAGIAVHPSPGHEVHTLVNALLARYPRLPGIGGEQRPGIVHRLDLNTSGLLMVAKTERGHASLTSQLAARKIRKGYLALVSGQFPAAVDRIEAPIGRDPGHRQRMAVVAHGRPAETLVARIVELGNFTLMFAMPLTGRTHQIRVHLAAAGHPIAGDSLYGRDMASLSRQFLHAVLLRFARPCDGSMIEVVSVLPEDLAAVLERLLLESGVQAPLIDDSIRRMLACALRRFQREAAKLV